MYPTVDRESFVRSKRQLKWKRCQLKKGPSSSAEANPAREKREHVSSEDAYHAENITQQQRASKLCTFFPRTLCNSSAAISGCPLGGDTAANPKSKIPPKIALRAGRSIRLAGSECGKREVWHRRRSTALKAERCHGSLRQPERAPGDQSVSADPGAESRNGNLVFRKSRERMCRMKMAGSCINHLALDRHAQHLLLPPVPLALTLPTPPPVRSVRAPRPSSPTSECHHRLRHHGHPPSQPRPRPGQRRPRRAQQRTHCQRLCAPEPGRRCAVRAHACRRRRRQRVPAPRRALVAHGPTRQRLAR